MHEYICRKARNRTKSSTAQTTAVYYFSACSNESEYQRSLHHWIYPSMNVTTLLQWYWSISHRHGARLNDTAFAELYPTRRPETAHYCCKRRSFNCNNSYRIGHPKRAHTAWRHSLVSPNDESPSSAHFRLPVRPLAEFWVNVWSFQVCLVPVYVIYCWCEIRGLLFRRVRIRTKSLHAFFAWSRRRFCFAESEKKKERKQKKVPFGSELNMQKRAQSACIMLIPCYAS